METSIDIHVRWNQAFQQCTANVHQSQCNADIRHNLSRSGQYFISSKIELISNAIRVSVSSFLLIVGKIRYLRLLGLFLNSSSCLQHFLIKLSCLLLLPLGRKKIHFSRMFTFKPVTSLHTNILMHSLASQGQPQKGQSGCCRGVNHSIQIKAKEKIHH